MTRPEPSGPAPPPLRVGPYRTIHEIGRGGMGSVWLAERSDNEYRGLVALKLVKRGMDTDFVLQRFRAERQILASLSHPNIARMLDGGTTDDGLPFFAMEYIEGQSLIDFCNERDLGVAERIGLFRIVCAAVQHAHRSLVVHRDIKPSNILITPEGIPKLLDFGLAKVLDPERSGHSDYRTLAKEPIFTPEYASPEQVRGEPVTTSTDVYSLGIVLYEALSGRHPFRREGQTLADLARAIVETEPPAPSVAAAAAAGAARTRALKGDLDTIILKALQKEPERRYATVEQLSDDLRRHLEGLPVSARADTFVYRTGKFVRRHKVGVVASVLVAASLITGLSAALWQVRAARQKQALAQHRFDDVRRLANTLLFDVNSEMEQVPGSTKARELLVKNALAYLDRLAKEAAPDRGLKRDLSAAYLHVGDIQGGVGVANIGDTAGALVSYRRASEIREAIVAGGDATPEDRIALAESLQRVAELAPTNDERISIARRAVGVLEAAADASPASLPVRLELQSAENTLADVLAVADRHEEALAVHRTRLTLCEEIVRAEPENFRARRAATVGYYKIGQTLNNLKRWEEALPPLAEARRRFEALARENPDRAQLKSEAAFAMVDSGHALAALGRFDEALEPLRAAVTLRERLVAEDAADAERSLFLIEADINLGEALVGAGRKEEGLGRLRRARDQAEQRLKADPLNERAREIAQEAREACAASERAGGT